MVTTQDDIIG